MRKNSCHLVGCTDFQLFANKRFPKWHYFQDFCFGGHLAYGEFALWSWFNCRKSFVRKRSTKLHFQDDWVIPLVRWPITRRVISLCYQQLHDGSVWLEGKTPLYNIELRFESNLLYIRLTTCSQVATWSRRFRPCTFSQILRLQLWWH